MKRILLALLAAVLLPVQAAHAQISIIAPIIDEFIMETKISQVAYYLGALDELIKSATNTGLMLENLARQVEMSTKNLSRIGDVKSFKELMEWYNRQLYLERRSEEAFNSISLTIGKKNYKITMS